jgi:hypothetical protein
VSKLTGKLEWTLFEQAGGTMCRMAPVARITTGDGALIRFEGRGYAIRRSQGDPVWRGPDGTDSLSGCRAGIGSRSSASARVVEADPLFDGQLDDDVGP